MNSKEKIPQILHHITAITAIITAIAFVVQLLHIYFTAEGQMYTAETVSAHFKAIAFLPILLLLLIAAGLVYDFIMLNRAGDAKQISAVKVSIKENAESLKAKKKLFLVLRISVTVAAVIFIVIGISNGGMYDVFVKAVNICTECIGLG